MNSPHRLDERDPFVQLIFRSTLATVVLVFVAAFVLSIYRPDLLRPMIVPLGAAFFCGTLAFLAEAAKKRYVFAVLGLGVAIALFPALGWLLLVLLHVPYQSRAADFITLIPQGVAAPSFYLLIRKRFENGSSPTLPKAQG